ncbi:Rad9 [Aureococcus anophagefferens]|nr:Rad9 [Aureococcus anophagefferens]
MSPLYNKETRVKSPPAALRQSVGRPLNAFDGCAWRRPGAVLVLRVPKAASTALTNAMREFRGRYKFVDVAEWPGAVGLTAAPRPPSALAPAVEARMQESKIHRFATGAAARDGDIVLAGHTFLPVPATGAPTYAVVAIVREPEQRLASGYHYVSSRYLCGYSTTLCEGPGAVYRAIANVNETVLLTIPAERIDDGGYRALARLLPGYFSGIERAAAAVEARYGGVDSRGARRSPRDPEVPWVVADSAEEIDALAELCGDDQRVYDFAARLFDGRLRACDARYAR